MHKNRIAAITAAAAIAIAGMIGSTTQADAAPRYQASASASAKAYPWAYKWCASFNPGWVCPS